MKTTLTLAALFIFVLAGGYASYAYTHKTTPTTYSPSAAPAQVNTVTTTASTTTNTTTSAPSVTTTASGYTSAQVATHNTAANCWTSINGSVYDLTKWIGTHPGGEAAIIQLCGTDGTSAFSGQHGNDNRANKMLATFVVGPLAN